MRIDDLLDDGELWRDVVVGDNASRAAAVRHYSRTSSAEGFGVTAEQGWTAGLVNAVVTGTNENLNAVLTAREIIVAGIRRGDNHCEVTG